jgi:hypothetical protein
MSRSHLIAVLASAFLVAPAALPSPFAPSTTLNLCGSAEAAAKIKSTKANAGERARMGGGGGTTKRQGKTRQPTQGGPAGIMPRMGGGGGTK